LAGLHLLAFFFVFYIASMTQEQQVLEAWQKTSWAKKLESRKRRASLTDFDRFKLMVAKKQRSKIISEKLTELAA